MIVHLTEIGDHLPEKGDHLIEKEGHLIEEEGHLIEEEGDPQIENVDIHAKGEGHMIETEEIITEDLEVGIVIDIEVIRKRDKVMKDVPEGTEVVQSHLQDQKRRLREDTGNFCIMVY